MAERSSLTISIEELRVGMFVTKLDIPWLSSPFLTHSRLIKKRDDIDALIKCGVKELVIDPSKGIEPERKEAPPPPIVATVTPASPSPKLTSPAKTDFEQELQVAFVLRSKIKRSIENIQQSLQLEKPIETTELLPLIDSTLDSLARNDQALMSLAHLSRKAQRIADHAFGTFCLSLNLALQLKITATDREQLGLAALLHEAGWVQLPLNLMGKRTPYTAAEEKLVQQHTLNGEKILKGSNLPELTGRIIAEHHERLDGRGYPRRLRGEQVHWLTQLFSVVDTYEERVHQLTDQPGMLPINAMRSLYRDAEQGGFNVQIVASFISMLGVYPATTAVLLNTGEKGVVIFSHADAPLAPVIEIHYRNDGKLLNEPLRIDLNNVTTELKRTIEKAIDPTHPGVDPHRRLILSEDHLN
jgi:HD-GYP domain-containing protein (c-di-GMP phosphodiesterase class II)